MEADGIFVKTQREPAHQRGYEVKCASAYEGWQQVGHATPGHPRPHYRLVEKQVYGHVHDAQTLPFWEGVSLALSRTYDLSQVPLVVVGGDGANWIDTAEEGFQRVVRQRDGFHLARDAARGWGKETGAQLYEALRTADQPTTLECLALPAPKATPAMAATTARALPSPAPPAPPATNALPAPAREAPRIPEAALPASSDPTTASEPPLALVHVPAAAPLAAIAAPSGSSAPLASSERPAKPAQWSRAQVKRARTTVTATLTTDDAGRDWRLQVAPEEVPADARALGTMEGTNFHLFAKRTKRKGMAWTVDGARAMLKVRELVANHTLPFWSTRASTTTAASPALVVPHTLGGFAPPGPLPWPQVSCPAAHGPLSDPFAATLHRINTGGRFTHRLT